MKLIFCTSCGDVFQLRRGPDRSCECGRVKGRYVDNVNAVTNGEGVSLAIGNGSLSSAVQIMRGMAQNRAFYPVMCWARPNDGPANPHTKVTK